MRLVIVGGSDAGISAALRARELSPDIEVSVVLADRYPNFSICGIPYHVSGEVPDWRALAHRSTADLAATGIRLITDTTVTAIDPAGRRITATPRDAGPATHLGYNRLIVGTGAVPQQPPIAGLDSLGPADGVHVLHTMGDTFALTDTLTARAAETAVIIGAGYIGLEMAEALTHRGLSVTVLERLDQVLPRTLDPELADLVAVELRRNGVRVHCGAAVDSVGHDPDSLTVTASGARHRADLVLVVTGVQPDTGLLAAAGARLGIAGSIAVDEAMRTTLPDIYAAGDCVHTHHRLLPEPAYLPLGTTAHKQGRVAGENAAGGRARFAGSLGTQVVRVFGLVAAATGLRDTDATAAGFEALTVAAVADDRKAYYPGASPIHMRLTGDRDSGRLLGAQLVGRIDAHVAKRIDILATAITYRAAVADLDTLDLSYTPPLGSPYDAVQQAAQAWMTAAGRR